MAGESTLTRVLRSRYGLAKEAILGAFSGLLDSTEVRIEDEVSVEKASTSGGIQALISPTG
jgi:hypothetical protein